MVAAGRYLSRTLRCFVLLMSGLIYASGAHAEQDLDTERYHRAVEYCRGDVMRPMMLSPDRNVLCVDGVIMELQTDLRYVEALAEGGLFVVRSAEGDGTLALAISKLLLQRRATVVIYDYCLSACATYFFFASVRTYVLKGALVAWQNGGSGFPACPISKILNQYGPWTEIGEPCDPLPHGFRNRYDQYRLERQRFYSERSNSAKSAFPPTSMHIATYIANMLGETGVYPNVAWTLNPAYLYWFKTKIHYETYPASQDEVDEIVARLQIRLQVRKVIYDP